MRWKRLKTPLLLCLTLFLADCPRCAENRYDLITVWSSSRQMQEPCQAPYTVEYTSLDKKNTLIFLSSKHDFNINSPTCELIKKSIESNQPSLVILEGFSKEDSKEKLVSESKFCISQNNTCPENLYGVYLSNQHNIPFAGGEPSDNEIWKHLQQSIQLKQEDFLGFYLLRQVPQWKNIFKNISLRKQKELITEFLHRHQKEITFANTFSYENFLAWYFERFHQSFVFKKIHSDLTAPSKSTNLGRIAQQINLIRAKYLAATIEEGFEKYAKVLVIYGAGHFVELRDYLDNYFNFNEKIRPSSRIYHCTKPSGVPLCL